MPTFNGSVGASNGDAVELGSGTCIINDVIRVTSIDEWIGWLFANVTIPQGAVILSAYLEVELVQVGVPNTATPWHQFWGQAADDAGVFAATTSNISGRTRTSASMIWNQVMTGKSTGDRVSSPTLASIIQEIVNRPGWASGNDIAIVAKGLAADRYLGLRFYDNAAGDAAALTVTYAVDQSITGTDGTLALTGEAGSFDTISPVDFAGADGELLLTGEAGAFDIAAYSDIGGTDGTLALAGEPGAFGTFRWFEEPLGRLRADLYSVAGVKLASAPITDFVLEYEEVTGETGSFSMAMPASLEAAAAAVPGVRVRLFREDEGDVFHGIIRARSVTVDGYGEANIVVKGPSSADDLVGANLMLGRPYESKSPTTIAEDLLSLVPGWTLGIVGAPRNGTTSISAEGASVLSALRQLAERTNLQLRIDNVGQVVDLLDLEPEENRVFNGDFEIPVVDGTAGWEDAISTSVTITPSSSEFYSGAWSAEVETLADGVHRGIIQTVERLFGVTPGKVVRLAFALKAPSTSHTYEGYFAWFDEDAAQLGDSIVELTPTTTDWELHAATAPAPAAAAWCRVGVLRKDDAAVTFYVDDITATVDNDVEESGIRLAALPVFNPEHAEDYPSIVPIGALELLEESNEVWNSLLPVGSGEGEGALTLEHTTRFAPYEVMSEIAPDGRGLLYIEDAASIATHGRRRRVIADKHAVPAEASSASLAAASNALYDAAVTALVGSKDERTVYRVKPGPMPHVDTVAGETVPRFRIGQRVHVTYRGVAERSDGTGAVYLDLNERLFLRAFRRRLAGDGSDEWDLDVTDGLGARLDAQGMFARMLDQVWALQVEPRLVPDSPENVPSVPTAPSETSFDRDIDLSRMYWLISATVSFEVNQSGGGNWGGTIEINGTDRTAALGGTFATGSVHTVNIKPYLTKLQTNRIVFSKGSDFTLDATVNVRGVRL